MIDFECIVENILTEAETTESNPVSNQQTQQPSNPTEENKNEDKNKDKDEVVGNAISNFLINDPSNPYNKLMSIWTKSFGPKGYTMCTKDELNSICYQVSYGSTRGTKAAENFPRIESNYPLLDLCSQLHQQAFKGKTKPDFTLAVKIVDSFIKKLQIQIDKNKGNMKPMDYVASDPWAQSVKQSALAKVQGELGKLRLESLPKDSSIYQIIFNLLSIRKKLMIPKLNPILKMVDGTKIVNDIMLAPWNLVSGKYAINDQKLKATYDDVTVQDLVNVSLAAYALYEQQTNINIGEEKANLLLKDSKKYAEFLGGNKPAVPMNWDVSATNPTNTQTDSTNNTNNQTAVNSSFDQSYELLSRQILKEMVPSSITDPYDSREGSSKDNKANAEEKQQEPEESLPFKNKDGSSTYNLNHIREASTKYSIQEATNLLKQLQNLADYIKTKEGFSLANLTGIFKGATLGVQNMGT